MSTYYRTQTTTSSTIWSLDKYTNEDGTGSEEYISDVVSGNEYVCVNNGLLQLTQTGTANTEGLINISKLTWGKYVIREKTTQPGYAVDMTTPITDSEFKLTGQFAMDAGSAISERKTINYTTTDA